MPFQGATVDSVAPFFLVSRGRSDAETNDLCGIFGLVPCIAEDAPESRKATLEFLDVAKKELFQLCVSQVVFFEFSRASEELSKQLNELVSQYHPILLDFDDEADRMANEYLRQGVVPPSKVEDAQHVAVAVVNSLDFLLSWNYRHLVNMRRREAFHHVSMTNGYYKELQILTPPEVSYGN